MSDITRIISRIEDGDLNCTDELLPLVYLQLRRMAEKQLSDERSGQTLQATALVHEAYMKLVKVKDPQQWSGRNHFFAAAAEAMRRIIVDHARRKRATKRGGGVRPIPFDDGVMVPAARSEEIFAVSEALSELESHDANAAQIVKLRYFVGMQHEEAAMAMGITKRAADRLWRIARTWIRRQLDKE